MRRYRDLESPAARHGARRIGKAADMAAAGSFDGPMGVIAAMIMARANRAAEQEAVAEPPPRARRRRAGGRFGPGVGLRPLAGRLTGGRIAGMPFGHVSLAVCRGIAESWPASGPWRGAPFLKPDSGHIGTVSLTVRVRWASWNPMKPRIECVLTQWNAGFTASGGGPGFTINLL